MNRLKRNKKVWIIANRLPFTIEHDAEGQTQIRRSSGGLVNALTSYYESDTENTQNAVEKFWVGVADCTKEEWDEKIVPLTSSLDVHFLPVFVQPEVYNNYYNGFSNAVLWPLFHYFPSLVSDETVFYDAYVETNRAFADTLIPHLEEDDTVWVHDYQLMLLPGMLRERFADLKIGFFLHIPFPSYELFRILPQRGKKAIAEGLMGADLIGFHTYEYVQHFIQSMKMTLGVENSFHQLFYQNRMVRTELFPLGIDYKKFSTKAASEEVAERVKDLQAVFTDVKLIFSVDRLDYSKGFMNRLKGWEYFLENYPEWREKVVFQMTVVPSRDAIDSYLEKKREIEEKVSTINGKYSTLTWQPIIYRYNHLAFDDLIALYVMADVALITPLRDGMNLVAKEFVACQLHQQGVLILSELAGAAMELNEAILVNPYDIEAVAQAIHDALTMPAIQKAKRIQVMQKRLQQYDVMHWINDFLQQLEQHQKTALSDLTEAWKDLNKFINTFESTPRRLFLLDYDGTLAPITTDPEEARPTEAVRELLRRLAALPGTKVAIISGRKSATLEEWLGDLPVTLSAEHGSMMREPGQAWIDLLAEAPAWKAEVLPIMETFVNRCVGSFIEEKKNTVAWHYRNTRANVGFERSRELLNNLQILLQNTPLQVLDGNKVVEVKSSGFDKGFIARNLYNIYQPGFVCCIGDDVTDEDMFKAIKDYAITIKVKPTNTVAEYYLRTQPEVLDFLTQFLPSK